MLVVDCPDWPVVAAGFDADVPVAVVAANEVVACSAAAREAGVEPGLRRRLAQSRCPSLVVVGDDPGRDARAFEPVVVACESFTPSVEILRPGVCAFATRGPSRYFGGDDALAATVAGAVRDFCLESGPGGRSIKPRARVGVADGRFAARLAAVRNVRVPPGESAVFLAEFPVEVLDNAGLAHLLRRLGVRTLGDLARLPAGAVLARFGDDGRRAHRLARGLDDLPLAARVPPPGLTVSVELEPPVTQADTAAFAAKSLADRLCGDLARQGLVVTGVRVEAETEHGDGLARLWHHDPGLDPAALAQRVRWQLDGWFTRANAPSGGLTLLRLVPERVVPDRGQQLGFWGGGHDGDERASRALARVQGMFGHHAVVTGVRGGGRSPGEQIRLVPWGDPVDDEPSADQPWPGVIPAPAPATVHTRPVPADVVDTAGAPVAVTGRGRASAEPARLRIDGGPWAGVDAWAGPWPVDERWWDGVAHRRRARWQLVTDTGAAHLLQVEGGRWWVEATYD